MPRILIYVGGTLIALAIYLEHGTAIAVAFAGAALIFAWVFEAIRVYKAD